LKNGKTEEKKMTSNGEKNEDKKKKKEEKKKDRRLSGSYPPANSVRVDDLTPLDGEEGEGEGEGEVGKCFIHPYESPGHRLISR
jgi:hypothetical protein